MENQKFKRFFTKKFTPYSIYIAEQAYGIDCFDFMDVGNLSVNKMVRIIVAGNGVKGKSKFTEEDALDKLQEWQDMGYDLIEAYIQLLAEYDRDQHILRYGGTSIEKIKEDIFKNVEALETKLENEQIEMKASFKDIETPKADVNSFVSID